MKDYEHFKMVALRAKKGDTIPRFSETVFVGNGKDCVVEFTSWRTDVIQAVAEAALLGALGEDEELIIIVKKHEKEED